MRLLLIHTSGAEGSLALADASGVVATETLPGRTSSELLVPKVRQMMELCGWRLGELTAIVVVHGPGSFTGVRVGVSAAKGLSEAGGGVALIAISRLALVADSAGEGDGLVHAVLDAGRGQFYYGQYKGRRCMREALLTVDEVVAASSESGGVVVACEAKVAEELPGLRLRLMPEPLAGDAVPLALERIERGEFDDAMTMDANYLRQTDTEILSKMKLGRA
jgi:tRNA threonylcarbamoyladenosine biosynthesis protein TsaB